MKDLRIKIVLSLLLIISGAALTNYSSISPDIKNIIAEISTIAGTAALVITIIRARREKKTDQI
jgi:hypothetical protein